MADVNRGHYNTAFPASSPGAPRERPHDEMPRYLFSSASRSERCGGVFTFDSHTGERHQVVRAPCRGLTPGPGGCFFAVDRDSAIHRIEPGTWQSEVVTTVDAEDAHDLRWIDDGFYLIASLGNRLLRLDADLRIVDEMRVVDDERDICHLNCLAWMDDALFCTLFTLTPGDRKAKRLSGAWMTEGKVIRVDFAAKSFEVVHEPLGQPHNPTPRAEGLYVTESHWGRVTRVAPAAGTSEVAGRYYGFVRGLAFGPGETLVGVCRLYRRERLELQQLPLMQHWRERFFPFAGILVVDPRTWRTRRRHRLRSFEVYDIMPLD